MERAERMVWTVRAVGKQQKQKQQQQHKGGSDLSPTPRSPAHKAHQHHHKLHTYMNGGDRDAGMDSESSREAAEAAANTRGDQISASPDPQHARPTSTTIHPTPAGMEGTERMVWTVRAVGGQ